MPFLVMMLFSAALQAQPAAGWQPGEMQDARARETHARFMAATDAGRFKEAYLMLSAPMQSMTSYDKYVAYHEEFRNISGGSPRREAARIDWYKDPPGAPERGIYAIFKSKCAFRNIDVCEENIILHEEAGGAFLVTRAERSYVRNKQP